VNENEMAAQAADALDFMEAGAGYDGMSASQFVPMYLRILHLTAPQITEGMPEFVPGAKAGDFFNDLTGKSYGKSLDLIPLRSDILWFEYHPTKLDFKGIHAPFSIDVYGDEYKGMFIASGENQGNRIVPTHVFYVLVADELAKGNKTIGILSFHKSGIPHAKVWNTRIRQVLIPVYKDGVAQVDAAGQPVMDIAPYFSSVWRLTTELNTNDQGSWYTIGKDKVTHAERLRFVNREAYNNAAKPMRAQVDNDKGAMQAALAQGETRQALTDNAGKDSEY
jgi:hypothetical protein